MKGNKLHILLAIFCLFFIVFAGCKDGEQTSGDDTDQPAEVEIDSTTSTLVKFDNTLFSVPSPYQVAYLVKEMELDFNKEYLNPLNRSTNYTNNFKKALNLGVYGADLGYLNIYEQTPNAIQYFSIVKKFAHELGISSAFNADIIKRVDANMGKKDSLMYIISHAYRAADSYLKNNARPEISALILAGGWVESLHIMTQITLVDQSQIEIVNRIGEQKHPLDNLIKVLSPYYNESAEFAELLDGLIDLAYEFDGIEFLYTYAEPEVNPDRKLTTINSKSEIVISEEQLQTISEKIKVIRNKIIE